MNDLDSIDTAWRNVEMLIPEGMAVMITSCGPSCENPGRWHVSVAPDTRNGDAVYYAEGEPAAALREIADAIVTGRKVTVHA